MIYYNEIDKNAVAWLRELMDRDIIPRGDIDERSIELVQPGDIAGYRTCHFFAGIGVWAYAGRLAGLPDDYPWWSGSCPCQPFSVSGKRRGTADRRHLWPHLFRLISARRPACVLGEQVAQKAGWNWFNGVRADLAGEAYQCRGVGLCSCAVDSPDERERIYWGAVAYNHGFEREPGQSERWGPARGLGAAAGADVSGALVNGPRIGRGEGQSEPIVLGGRGTTAGANAPCEVVNGSGGGWQAGQPRSPERRDAAGGADAPGTVGDGNGARLPEREGIAGDARAQRQTLERADDAARNGSWYADAEWIACHDGKARRAKSGTSMLVAGFAGRVPLWRGLGGSINAQLASEVIKAFVETVAP